MRALHRKLLRDLWHMRGQVFAIALVVACGVANVVSARIGYQSLTASRAAYYAEYRFADVFAPLKRAPLSAAARIAAIPGVTAVRPRIVFDVTLDIPGLDEPAAGRLLSIPERRVPMLNDVYLRRGLYVSAGRRDEVLISEAFAAANGLDVGDSFGAVLNGRWARLRIAGIALSPEYIYEIRGSELFPDNRRFGVLWMSEDAMGPAFDMDGAFNDVSVSIARGAREPEVIARIDRILERYGGQGAYGREDNISHRFLSDEIRQNRIFGTIMPVLFLSIAAFLINIVLTRLIAMQRDQVGVLKAFGYRRGAVARHYLGFAMIAVLIGAALGTGLGIWLGKAINEMYVRVYRFPVLRFEPGLGVAALAVAVSAVAAILGAGGAVRRAWALPAAEAMRPDPPARFRAGLLERLGALKALAMTGRMIVRHLTRRPLRAALSALGIAFAVGIVVLGRFFVEAIEHIGTVQFRLVQREDITVITHDPVSGRARHEIAHLPGVLRSEPFRAVLVRLRHENLTRRVPLFGLGDAAGMRRLVDRDTREVSLPPDGLVLTAKLAEVLRVSVGESLTVQVLEGARPTWQVPVTGLVDELMGTFAYMDLRALNRLLREGPTTSGALLRVDAAAAQDLYARLKRLPAVAGVALRQATLRSFEKTLGESLGIFTTIFVLFSCAIAVAVVYNAARIALSERGRDLASLRVLGFTRREIAVILLGEQAVIVVLAIPLGLLLGYFACAALASIYQWELFRLPLVVTRTTYLFAVAVVAAAAILSGLLIRRRLDRLDLVAVLKTRE